MKLRVEGQRVAFEDELQTGNPHTSCDSFKPCLPGSKDQGQPFHAMCFKTLLLKTVHQHQRQHTKCFETAQLYGLLILTPGCVTGFKHGQCARPSSSANRAKLSAQHTLTESIWQPSPPQDLRQTALQDPAVAHARLHQLLATQWHSSLN
eukprot:2416700-Amphidinium_carterae.1